MSDRKEKSTFTRFADAVLKAAALTGIGSYIIKATDVANFSHAETKIIAVISSFGGVALLILASFVLVESIDLPSESAGGSWARVIVGLCLALVFGVLLLSVTAVLWQTYFDSPTAASS